MNLNLSTTVLTAAAFITSVASLETARPAVAPVTSIVAALEGSACAAVVAHSAALVAFLGTATAVSLVSLTAALVVSACTAAVVTASAILVALLGTAMPAVSLITISASLV